MNKNRLRKDNTNFSNNAFLLSKVVKIYYLLSNNFYLEVLFDCDICNVQNICDLRLTHLNLTANTGITDQTIINLAKSKGEIRNF